jgi:hypothetical protein
MLTISQVLYNEPGKPGLGQGFKVKLMKEGFDSETNVEFIPVWVRDRQAVLVIRNAVLHGSPE